MTQLGGPDVPDALTSAAAAVSPESAEIFAQLALELHEVDGVEETVEAVVKFALSALACVHAGIVLVARGRQPEILALTDPSVAALYRVQIELGEGPLIAAIDEDRSVLVADVETETGWPSAWQAVAIASGIGSLLHLPLTADGRPAAVLSLFRDMPGGFDADDLAVAHILARHAAVAVASARKEANLEHAVDARKLVGQAMGILMERYDLDGDRAFEVLRRYSKQNNRKLRDVAQELIDTRQLPRDS